MDLGCRSVMANSEFERKIVYYLDDDNTPYMVRLHVDSSNVTLGDVKSVFVKSNCKCFFKALDPDYGFVKEEISDVNAQLPCYNGQIVCWLVSTDRSLSDSRSQVESPLKDSRTSVSPTYEDNMWPKHGHESSSRWAPTSDIGSMSFVGSSSDVDMQDQLYESIPDSNYRVTNHERDQFKVSLSGSVADSNYSVNTVVVTLSVGSSGYLGIGLVGTAYCGVNGHGGVYVGSVVDGSPAAIDGQIGVGDRILEVNDVCLDGLSSDSAIQVLRESIHERSPITLVIAKYRSSVEAAVDSRNYFSTLAGQGSVDAHPWQMQKVDVCQHEFNSSPRSFSPVLLPSSSANTSPAMFTVNSNLADVARAMARINSGLKVCNRSWLKITIPNAFIGSDVVYWLLNHVDGLKSRRDAKKFASRILKAGHIHDVVKKFSFSEKCYYVFEKSIYEGANLEPVRCAMCGSLFDGPAERGVCSVCDYETHGHILSTTSRTSGSVTGSIDSAAKLRERIVCADQTPVLPLMYLGHSTDQDSLSIPSVAQQQHLCTPSLADTTSASFASLSHRMRFNLTPADCSQELRVIGSV